MSEEKKETTETKEPPTISFRDFSVLKEVDGKVCRVFTVDGCGDYAAPQVIGAGHRDRIWQGIGRQVAESPDKFSFPKVGTPKEQEDYFKKLKWTDVIEYPYSFKLAQLEAVLTPLDNAVPVKDMYENATGLAATQLLCIDDFFNGNVKSRTFESAT